MGSLCHADSQEKKVILWLNETMIKLPVIRDVLVAEKKVLVRADLETTVNSNSNREKATRDIIEYLLGQRVKNIKVIGHKGQFEYPGVTVVNDIRADRRERENSEAMAAELADGWDVYVNESFAESHRKYTSVEALPRLMASQGKPVCVGLRFEKEIEELVKVNSKSNRLAIIGGAKGDKEDEARKLEARGWKVLRGGLLPGAKLRPDGLDISDEEIKRLSDEVTKAEVIVLAGPMGKYEDNASNAFNGTVKIFTAVANSKAHKIAGGGDTEAALEKFGLKEKMDWISVGGGAMLEFLATGTLPGIEAVIS